MLTLEMSKRIIDLSFTVVPKASWAQWPRRLVGQEEPVVDIREISSFEEDGLRYSKFQMATQAFTHMDAPSHYDPNGLNCDEVPLEKFVGVGVVFDVTYKKPREGVSAKDLENSGVHINPEEFAVIRTGWTDDAPWGTERFWTEMIYLEPSIGEWLVEKKVKGLVYDCFADPPFLEKCEKGGYHINYQGSPNHERLLKAGIPLFTFCRNLRAIGKPRVTIVALPLKLKGTDGAPARVIAIEDD